MTRTIIDLVGDYAIEGSRLHGITDPSIELLVGVRKHESPERPQNFLLTPSPTGGYQYLADIVPVRESPLSALQAYRFRYHGRILTLEVHHVTALAVIRPDDGNTIDRRENNGEVVVINLGNRVNPSQAID